MFQRELERAFAREFARVRQDGLDVQFLNVEVAFHDFSCGTTEAA
jgi:hypothetical protein